MVTMQRHTPILIRGTRKHRLHKFAAECVWGLDAALGASQHFQRDRRQPLISEEPLMRGRIVGLDEGLVALLSLGGRPRQGKLIVI
jgi:hypothetical protein